MMARASGAVVRGTKFGVVVVLATIAAPAPRTKVTITLRMGAYFSRDTAKINAFQVRFKMAKMQPGFFFLKRPLVG
jgi:hypothetical protein